MTNLYEAMFVVEPTIAAREWNRVVEEIERLIKRNGATVASVVKWGERRLIHPVKRSNRGAYVLTYFQAPPGAVNKIRADLQLSEIILRSLVVRHEGEMRKEIPKDFETAGLVPIRRESFGGGEGGEGRGGDRPRF